YLSAHGFSAAAIGGVLTATLVEDAVFTALVAGLANRLGRRRLLTACSLLISFAGVMLAIGDRPWVLVVGAVLGTLSPSGQEAGAPRTPAARMGLHRSRGIVLEMAGLQALDSLAGGFIVQSLLVYWFHLRFGVGADALGPLFFGTNLLSAVSFLVAARVAARV